MAEKHWVQGAIKRPGALRAKAKAAGKINSQGNIDRSWLQSKAKGDDLTAKQARLALTMRKMKH